MGNNSQGLRLHLYIYYSAMIKARYKNNSNFVNVIKHDIDKTGKANDLITITDAACMSYDRNCTPCLLHEILLS